MIKTLQHRLINGWNTMRVVRLAFSVFILVQAVQIQEPILIVLGGIFLFQATFNYGCCAAGACDTGLLHKKTMQTKDIEYTEIK